MVDVGDLAATRAFAHQFLLKDVGCQAFLLHWFLRLDGSKLGALDDFLH